MENIKEIKVVRLEKLSIGEYAQFIKATISLVEKITPEKIGIKPELLSGLKKQSELLTEIIGQSYISKETKELASSFKVGRNNADRTKKEASVILYDVCKNYIGVQSLPVRTKTQFISSMINDLNKPENKAHIDTLGLSESLTALENNNKAYQNLSEGRAESQLANTFVSFKEVKKATNNLYKVLTKYAFATNLLTPTEESKSFMNLLNKLIEDTHNANKQRLAQAVLSKKGNKLEGGKAGE